jgi:hypothetical protein
MHGARARGGGSASRPGRKMRYTRFVAIVLRATIVTVADPSVFLSFRR